MSSLKTLTLAGLNPVMRLYRRKLTGKSHQRKFLGRAEQKWRLIESELGPPGSLLDIGCNEGYFTLQAAEKGWCAWGVERLDGTVAYARRAAEARGLDTALFFNGALTPEAVRCMPRFDVILFLSSYHDFHHAYGGQRAFALFDDLLRVCRRKMLFEPASTSRRFSKSEPVFDRDNDRDAIEAWVRALVARSSGWRARYVGATPYSDIEPYRFMFAVERA